MMLVASKIVLAVLLSAYLAWRAMLGAIDRELAREEAWWPGE